MKLITDEWHRSRGAAFEDYFGSEIPSHYGNPEQEYWNLRNAAVVRDASHFGKVKITGKDAQMFLHRMVSNDIKNLTQGNGVYALFLDIKGHIQGDFKLYAFPDHLLMVLQPYVRERVVKGLDRYVISEQVTFADVSSELALFQILGPSADSVLASRGLGLPEEKLSLKPGQLAGASVHVIRMGAGLSVLCAAADAVTVLSSLDVPPIGAKAFEVFRIEEGLSLLNKDVDDTNFPQECRMDAALNFHKGCYLGQEVMARIDAQGHVNRFLMGLLSDREPAAGEKLFAGDKEVGKVTSAARSPRYGKFVALGYVRREFAREGQELSAGDSSTKVLVKALPMAPA